MQYDEDEEYEYRRRRDGDAAVQLIGTLLKLGMSILAHGVLVAGHVALYLVQHTPVVLDGYWSGYLLNKPFTQVVAEPVYLQFTSGLAVAYTTEAAIYFFKGIMQQLRLDKKRIWWLLLIVSTLIICIAPALIAWRLLQYHYGQVLEVRIFGPLAVPVVAGLVYWRYKLHKDTCPAIVYWSYRLGSHAGKWA
jgi:hypothetical protein